LLLRGAGNPGADPSSNAEPTTAFIDANDAADGAATVPGGQARNEHCLAHVSDLTNFATGAFARIADDKRR
jgi:hypothetical protein